MPSPIRFGDFKRKFESFGVEIARPNKSSHFKMRKVINGTNVIYMAVKHKNKVDYSYLKNARRKFKLTPDDGVTDEDFKNA